MTENPPPPPPSDEGSARPNDFDPRRSMFQSRMPPRDEAVGCAQVGARIVLGIISFGVSVVLFTTILAATQPVIGIAAAVVLVGILFVIRKRAGPSLLLGAVVVGASVALVVFGGCMLILLNGKMDFR